LRAHIAVFDGGDMGQGVIQQAFVGKSMPEAVLKRDDVPNGFHVTGYA
jgi:hypothetical protein